MDSQGIKILLEKYYRGETSLDEEAQLKEYFSQNNPSNFEMEDKLLLNFFLSQQTVVPADLNSDLVNLIDEAWENETKLHFSTIVKWAGSVAAVLIIAVGVLVFNKKNDSVVLADSYKNPQEAYEETKKVLLFISNTMNSKTSNLKHISTIDNSLKRCNELSKIDETLNTIKDEGN
ncbi:MAG: hypothetical protein AB7S50_03680 [Bacteroidales bacterium]